MIKGKVIEILMDKYIIADEDTGNLSTAILSGNMKKNKVYVGDIVNMSKNYDVFVIMEISKRKNFVIRPPVSNIDQMILCISIDKPKPDYELLDKQIVLCLSKNIIPVICISKIDLLDDELKLSLNYIYKVYGYFKIVEISNKTDEGLNILKKILENKISAFSGNSGVGKSSVITKLLGDNPFNIQIGELTKKIERGRHTTKYVKLYYLDKNSYILDTPGFSSYELFDVNHEELKIYYPEFKNIKCSYLDCNHINEGENECKVKSSIQSGDIDKNRYDRYRQIYLELKQKDEIKYKTKNKGGKSSL